MFDNVICLFEIFLSLKLLLHELADSPIHVLLLLVFSSLNKMRVKLQTGVHFLLLDDVKFSNCASVESNGPRRGIRHHRVLLG